MRCKKQLVNAIFITEINDSQILKVIHENVREEIIPLSEEMIQWELHQILFQAHWCNSLNSTKAKISEGASASLEDFTIGPTESQEVADFVLGVCVASFVEGIGYAELWQSKRHLPS